MSSGRLQEVKNNGKSLTIRPKKWSLLLTGQHAKKVVSDSPGLVDFAIGLVDSVFNWPDWQVKFFEEFTCRSTVKSICSSKPFGG